MQDFTLETLTVTYYQMNTGLTTQSAGRPREITVFNYGRTYQPEYELQILL